MHKITKLITGKSNIALYHIILFPLFSFVLVSSYFWVLTLIISSRKNIEKFNHVCRWQAQELPSWCTYQKKAKYCLCLSGRIAHIKFKLFINKYFLIKPSSVNSCTDKEMKVLPMLPLQIQFVETHFYFHTILHKNLTNLGRLVVNSANSILGNRNHSIPDNSNHPELFWDPHRKSDLLLIRSPLIK